MSQSITVTQFRIGTTDVILQDYEPGKGKIIISDDDYGYNFSYYWGAMGNGSSLKDFLLSISPDYFVNKLGPTDRGDMDIKATMREVRAHWRKEGIPWYRDMDSQKTLRQELKMIESSCYDDRHFVEMMGMIENSFIFNRHTVLSSGYVIKDDFEEALDHLTSEPWNFIVHKEHRQNVWLNNFHTILTTKLATNII